MKFKARVTKWFLAGLTMLFLCMPSFAQFDHGGAPRGFSHDQGSDNLSDQDKVTSETYIHEGLSQQIKDEECNKEDTERGYSAQEMRDICAGRKIDTDMGPFKIDGNVVPLVIKAYSMVVGAGLMGKYTVKETAPTTSTAAPESAPAGSGAPAAAGSGSGSQDKEKEDYCKYAAIATEALGMFMQMSAQQNLANIPGNNANAQTEQLWKAKRSHEERATTAKVQATGWGITAGCYVVEIAAMGGWQDWTMWLKGALSGIATWYYIAEVVTQEKAAAKLGELIAKMPKAGDCNPITQVHCFCSQPTSVNDPQYMKYCQQQLHNRQIAENSTRIACVNKQLKADPSCACLNNGGCFDVQFMSLIDGLAFGKSMDTTTSKQLRDLSRGELHDSKLGSNTLGDQLARRNKNVMNQLAKNAPALPKINKGQLDIIKGLVGQGIPKEIAAHAVAAPAGSKKYADQIKAQHASYSDYSHLRQAVKGKGAQIVYYGGAGNLNKGSNKKEEFDFQKLLKKKKAQGRGTSSAQILNFAERAGKNADISHNQDVNIFDIISNRYRISGWRRVNLQ